ncbi:conserved protein of unknown function [Nitrospira japonica]|uniref:SAP domain-containing protein n=1 Tax=Nitrospira japonica TaxID=1325564 RepID=A0A1W1IA63_9BACT|nr:SAP domain-containing protein [Nitrospira japonica]SLM49937.1 conserved protein of unknown function [Nitrospira japonica]
MSAKTKSKRPPLTANISIDEFRAFYWYLHELVEFCRNNGLPTGGQKLAVVSRIERFIRSGKRTGLAESTSIKRRVSTAPRELSILTVVGNDFKCDVTARNFFKSVIGEHFHFTAHVNRFRRERLRRGIRTTYGDLAREWLAEHERRKDPRYKSKIERSWQYNQFVRDFAADKLRNRGKGMRGAAKAWNEIREHRGPHTYAEYVRITERRQPPT